jgi:hypothetical protein
MKEVGRLAYRGKLRWEGAVIAPRRTLHVIIDQRKARTPSTRWIAIAINGNEAGRGHILAGSTAPPVALRFRIRAPGIWPRTISGEARRPAGYRGRRLLEIFIEQPLADRLAAAGRDRWLRH